MKTSFRLSCLIVISALTGWCFSAEPAGEPLGYLRLVNTIAAGAGNVSVRVDGGEVYPKGYRFGAVTGGIGLTPGVHQVEVRREGVLTGSAEVTVVSKLTLTLVAHAEEIPAAGGKPLRHQARLLELVPREVGKGKVATFVSVSQTPRVPMWVRKEDGGWDAVEVTRLKPVETTIQVARGYVALRSGGRPLDAIPVADPGNYVVVLFDDDKGRLRSVSFRDDGEVGGD